MMELQTEGWMTWEIFGDIGKPAQPPSNHILWTPADTVKVGLAARTVLHLVFQAGASSLRNRLKEPSCPIAFSPLSSPLFLFLPSWNICGTSWFSILHQGFGAGWGKRGWGNTRVRNTVTLRHCWALSRGGRWWTGGTDNCLLTTPRVLVGSKQLTQNRKERTPT